MVEVNKTGLASEIDSIIAGLNLSTAETEVLSSIYKAAVDAGADASTILSELTSRIEAASSDSEITDVLTFSVITDIISANREMSVANLTALSALTNISTGSVYYVDSLEVPYIKTSGGWEPIEFNSQLGDPIIIGSIAYAWGCNSLGRLGDNTTIIRSSPVSVVGGFTDWIQVSGRFSSHSLGVLANGTAWAWGAASVGQLGDNTTVDKSSPVSIVGGYTDWTELSAGSSHSLGVRANGTAWAWGAASVGQLGTGNTTATSSPVLVAGGFTDWAQMSAGSSHSLGVRANGTAWTWGDGNVGKLGDGTTVNKSSPVSVAGGFTDWVSVSAGNLHSLGVRENGTAWAWGYNRGRLGDNTTIQRNSPVLVVGGFTDWTQVSAGRYHSLGVRANGTAWGWGAGNYGALGTGNNTDRNSPVSVVGGFTDWTQLISSDRFSLGLRANGTAWAWGRNDNGRLGDNTVITRISPVSVVGGFTDWTQVDAGPQHSLAIRSGIT